MRRRTSFLCWCVALGAAAALAQDQRPANPGQSKSPDRPKAEGAAGKGSPTPGKASPDRKRAPDTVKEGDMAPTFELKSSDGKKLVKLEALRGKPVALIFGSYT